MHRLLKKAQEAKRESKLVEFKTKFDPTSTEDWCEVTKDLVAMANSGGGVIVIGCDNSGACSGADLSAVLALDPAHISDKIHKYTETHFSEFEVHELERGSQRHAAVLVGAAPIPLVFCQAGTYQDPSNLTRQKTAFARGTVFFRHGAKSEPGTTEDIRQAIDRRLNDIRKEWIGGVRKVVEAPAGARVSVLPPEVSESESPVAMPIRLTDDPRAPAYRRLDADDTHPHRLKELTAEVKRRLPPGTAFGSFDVQVIRRLHGTDGEARFFHKPKFGSPQYSPEFADWIVGKQQVDPQFFARNRDQLVAKLTVK